MATINQLTPAQLFAAVTAAGDSTGRIGRYTVDSLTLQISNLPGVMNPLRLAYNEAVALLVAANLDPNNLTDEQAADTYYAMAYACAYGMLLKDAAGATNLPAENFQSTRMEFGERVRIFFNLAGKHYDMVGINRNVNPYFDNAQWQGRFEIVTKADATPDYPYQNSFTTIP